MTLWDFIDHFITSYGGIVISLFLLVCFLIFISYLLIKLTMLPAIKKFFREFDIFKSNVEELNKSVIRVEAQTKSTSDKVDLISKMTAENITEMKTIILMMNEAVAELGKTVNEILHEHYANHPKEKEHEEHHHRKKPP